MKFAILILIYFLAFGVPMSDAQASVSGPVYRYVITETGIFSSLDPLDADTTSNLPVARMIYATPLETSESNQLTSRVLESFRYDAAKRRIEWVVKSGLKFEDGTSLTPDDVAFSVARMAYTRPKFPVLASIDGVAKWSAGKDGLNTYPAGIKIDGQKISIQLTESVDHPLFRFCLELFSIIPRRCVDTSTGRVNCKSIPESGPYRIVSTSGDNISFARRQSESNASLPSPIQFSYIPASKVADSIGNLDAHTVVAGSEADYSVAAIKKISNELKIQFMPASRFEALLINHDVPPFSDKKCRQIFAKYFRSAFKQLANPRTAEGSVFTKILPGYETLDQLQGKMKFEETDITSCREKLGDKKLLWGFDEADRDSIFVEALRQTFTALGVKAAEPLAMKTRKAFSEAFSEGTIAFFNAGSGFWALDPAGDTKMLFTPNLHRPLKQITAIPTFQNLISKLNQDSNSFKAVNEYLFGEALFNVYGHQRRFFAAKDATLIPELNFAITSPAPWQVFKVKQ